MFDPENTRFRPGTLVVETLPRLPSPSWATDTGRKTMGKELIKLRKAQQETPLHELGWYMDIDNISNMFHWVVELHSFDPTLPLAKDMEARDVNSVVLEMRFGRQYPMTPPFVRVIRPRFLPFMQGGGGHVTAGGAMCMELLTNSGWSPANSMESVILQVRMALTNTEPTPARLQPTTLETSDYGILEALDAYKRAATAHGWSIPPDLEVTAGIDLAGNAAGSF
jgi:ubiquitin-conjugating enzyme E2 Q